MTAGTVVGVDLTIRWRTEMKAALTGAVALPPARASGCVDDKRSGCSSSRQSGATTGRNPHAHQLWVPTVYVLFSSAPFPAEQDLAAELAA